MGLQAILAVAGWLWFRSLCELPSDLPRHCLDNWRVWSTLGAAELALLGGLGVTIARRMNRGKNSVGCCAGAFFSVALQPVLVLGGWFWFRNLCNIPPAGTPRHCLDDWSLWAVIIAAQLGVVALLFVVLHKRSRRLARAREEHLKPSWMPTFAGLLTVFLLQAGVVVCSYLWLADLCAEPEDGSGSWGSASGSSSSSSSESWSWSESWSYSWAGSRRLQTAGGAGAGAGAAAQPGGDGGSGSWQSVQLPPLDSAELCAPYRQQANVCPEAAAACVDVVDLTGQNAGQPSVDTFSDAAVAVSYMTLAPGRDTFRSAIRSATGTDADASLLSTVCAAVGVIIVANVQLAAVKRPVSAALSRLAVAKKRSELTKLRSRVLGDEGHRATRRSVLKRSCLRITLACCDCVTPKPVWRLRAFLRTITHDLRYRTWMISCTVAYTATVASAHAGMPAGQRSVHNALVFYLNLMFLVESFLKMLDISPDPFAKDQYRRGPAHFLSSFDMLDLVVAVLVYVVPSSTDNATPFAAIGTLRALRLIRYLATTWLPKTLHPLRTATNVLIQSATPLLTVWGVLVIFGAVFYLAGRILLPDDGFDSAYQSVFTLLQTMDLRELPQALDDVMRNRSSGQGVDLLSFCFFMAWALIANGFVLSLATASLADVGERQQRPEQRESAAAVIAPVEEPSATSTQHKDFKLKRPDSAHTRPGGMIVKPDEVLKMFSAFGEECTQADVDKFFVRVSEVGQPLRLPTLLTQLEVDAAIAEAHITRDPVVHFIRNMLRMVRVLAIIDVVAEVWLWLGLRCARAGSQFDCWVPTSPTVAQTAPVEFWTDGMLEFPGTVWDTIILCFVRSAVVTYAAKHPRYWFSYAGIFCDVQIAFFAVKLFLASGDGITADSDVEFWVMVGIGLGVAFAYRLCSCVFVYADSLHAVAPRPTPAVHCLVRPSRVSDFAAAVRFFALCDDSGKGHVTEIELRRVLKALNGGERGTDDIRFDAAFLARDLMHQMDTDVDGKVYLHEYLQHASSGEDNPLTRLLLSKQMVLVLTAFTVADTSGERMLERSELGRFFTGIGLHMSEDHLEQIYLQLELDRCGRVDLFELLGYLTATRELPNLDAVPPAFATSASEQHNDPVQIVKIDHEDPGLIYPETSRPKVTFAVPLDPRHVDREVEEDEQLLPSMVRGTRPFLRPHSAAEYQKPAADARWRPSTAPSVVLGSSTYNLSLNEWMHDLRDDGGRRELINLSFRKIYDKCDHDPSKAMKVFSEIDVDGSGEVDHEEFEQALRRMGINDLTQQQVTWLIEELDADNDGSISSAEFMAMVFRNKGTLGAMVDGALEKIFNQLGGLHGQQRAMDVFEEIDADGSGELSFEEFEDGLNLLKVELNESQLEGVVQFLDKDGDGELSVREFIDGVFGGKHATKEGSVDEGNSLMRVTVLEAKVKHATDCQKYCLVSVGGIPEGAAVTEMGISKQTCLSEKRPIDISRLAKERILKKPQWKVDEVTKKPKGFAMPFEPEYTPDTLKVQLWGCTSGANWGSTAEDTLIGVGEIELDGITATDSWDSSDWVAVMDKETKKYAARVRVKTTWHPYIPPEIEPEPEAAPVPPCAKLLVRITEGSGFFSGDLGEEVDQLVPYFVGLIDDDPSFGSSSMTLRKTTQPMVLDASQEEGYRWLPGEDGATDLVFDLAAIPKDVELRLMEKRHDEWEDESTEEDRNLGHGFIHFTYLDDDELPSDQLWTKETTATLRRQIGEDTGQKSGTVKVTLVWDPTQREPESDEEEDDWPMRRLRATILGVRNLPESEMETSLFVAMKFGGTSLVSEGAEPSKSTERLWPKNTRLDLETKSVPKNLMAILMDDDGEVGSCTITSLLSGMPREDRWSKDEWITLASATGHECELHVLFHWETHPELVPDFPPTLRVTVLNARDLAKAERYGENDPYVEVTVNGKTKRTETVKEGGSNPAWANGKGEYFDFEVAELPDTIALRCLDDDVGKDDEIGTCVVGLRPKSRDSVPPWTRDLWNNLKGPDGKATGQLHTLVQFWDPTHHDLPPVPPQGRLRITILSGAKLPKMDLFGENDPYVVIKVDGVKKRTTTQDGGGAAPVWGMSMGERFDFFCTDMPPLFRFEVFDEDLGSADDLIGVANHSLRRDEAVEGHVPNTPHANADEAWSDDTWVELSDSHGKPAGRIHCIIRWSPDPDNDFVSELPPKKLVVTVISASDLPRSDMVGKNDPYVIVQAEDASQRTDTIEGGGENAEWDPPHGTRLEFPFAEFQMPTMIKFRVMDEDHGSEDDEIGFCAFSLLDNGLKEEEWSREETFYLNRTHRGKTNKSRGRLVVNIACESEPEPEPEEDENEAAIVATRRLEVTVVKARDLPSMDMFSDNDVYCTVQVGGELRRTTTIDDGGADPTWHGGSGETLYFAKKTPPQVLDLKVWDCDDDEPTNWLTATVMHANNLPREDTFGQNDPYAVLTVDGQIQRTPTIDGAGADVEWGTVMTWQLKEMPDSVDVMVMDADAGSKDDEIARSTFAFVDHEMGRGMIAGVHPEMEWEKEWSVQLFPSDGSEIFKQKKQPTMRVHFKWRPNVIEDDFIGSAMVPLGASLPADQDWNLDRSTSIFAENGDAAGTVLLQIRWNTTPEDEPMREYTKGSPQGSPSRYEPEPEPEPENKESASKVLSAGKAGSSIPASVAKAMREAELKRPREDKRRVIPKDDLGFELESRPLSAMSAPRQPHPREVRLTNYEQLMTYIEDKDVNGNPAEPRQIRPTSAAMSAPIVRKEIIADDDAQQQNPSVVVLAAIESVLTIMDEESGSQSAAVPWRSVSKVGPALSLANSRRRAIQRWHVVQMYGRDADAVELHRRRHGLSLDAVVKQERRQYRDSLRPYQFDKPNDWTSLVGGSAALICRIVTVSEVIATVSIYLTVLCYGSGHDFNCWTSSGGEDLDKPGWDSYGTGGFAGATTDSLVLCVARAFLVLMGPSGPDALQRAGIACCVGFLFGASKMIAHAVVSAAPTPAHSSLFTLGLLMPLPQLGLLYVTFWAAKQRSIKLRKALSTDPLQEERARVQAIAGHTHYKFEHFPIWCGVIVQNPRFEAATAFMVLVSSLVVTARGQRLGADVDKPLATLYAFCVAYFCIEMTLKAVTFGVFSLTRRREGVVDGALMPLPLLHTVRDALDTVVVVAALLQLLINITAADEDQSQTLANLLILRIVTLWWVPHLRARSVRVRGATVVVRAWRSLLGMAAVLFILSAVFAMLATAEFGGSLHRCVRGGVFVDSRGNVTQEFGTAAACEQAALDADTYGTNSSAWARIGFVGQACGDGTTHSHLTGPNGIENRGSMSLQDCLALCLETDRCGAVSYASHACYLQMPSGTAYTSANTESYSCYELNDYERWASYDDSASGSGSWGSEPRALVCAWIPLSRMSASTVAECAGNGGRWRDDIINFDTSARSWITVALASHQSWFGLAVTVMQSGTRQPNSTVLLPRNVAVDDSWPPQQPRAAGFFLILACTVHVLLARLWLAVIWSETDQWAREESVKADGLLPYQTERRAIRRRVGARLAHVLRLPELEEDSSSSESEDEDMYSVASDEVDPAEAVGETDASPADGSPGESTVAPALDETIDADDEVDQAPTRREICCKRAFCCGRCARAGSKYAMDESSLSLSPSKLDASSASLLPPSTPIQHDRRFITELSRYTTLYARITAFGEEGPDLEQLTYAFNEEELRLLLRMNSLLFWEDVRDPKTGAYRCEEKSKPHKVAVLHSNLHKLRPAGELRKMASGTGAFFERWPEVRPSTADVFAQEQSTVRAATMVTPRCCCNMQRMLRWLRIFTTASVLVEAVLLCGVRYGRAGLWEDMASVGSHGVVFLLLLDTGLLLLRRLLCCQWRLAARAGVELLIPAIAAIDLALQHLDAAGESGKQLFTPGAPSPKTAVVAFALLQFGHKLSPPGSIPGRGCLCGAPRRVTDSVIAYVKGLQTVFDSIFSASVASLPLLLFGACVSLAYAVAGTQAYGALWIDEGAAATALGTSSTDMRNGTSASMLDAGLLPEPTRFGTTLEAWSTLLGLALGKPVMQLYSGMVWAACDTAVRLDAPEDCPVAGVALYVLTYMFLARIVMLGVASIFVQRYRAVSGASTAAEEALRHVDAWCEAWQRMLLDPYDEHPATCLSAAASAPALLGTTLPCESLVEVLLAVPAPLGAAGAADPAEAVRELLLGMENLELRDPDGDAGGEPGGQALEFGCVLLAAVRRAAQCNAAVPSSAAQAASGMAALRKAFAVFFVDMANEKHFKDEKELREIRRRPSSGRPVSALRRPGSGGRPRSGKKRSSPLSEARYAALARQERAGRPGSAASRPGSAAGRRPGSAARRPGSAASRPSRPTSAASSRGGGSDASGHARPVTADATLGVGPGRLRPVSAGHRPVSAGAMRRAGEPPRVTISEMVEEA